MSRFARFESRTILRATLEMDTALSVGARLSFRPTGTDLPVIKGPDGLPLIPGSSIKGVVRFQAERILRAADLGPDFRACDPFDDPCIREPISKKEARETEAKYSERLWENSCTACRLFGSPWIGSRLLFKDASLRNASDLAVVTQIRDGVGIDRDLGAAATTIKYDFETVVPGAQFDVEVIAENVELWELGFLMSIFRLWGEGHTAIGGKSTRGTGWGRLHDLAMQRVEKDDMIDYLVNGTMRPVSLDDPTNAFRGWIESVRGRSSA